MTEKLTRVVDFDARQAALDIGRSIAVQAPAGSGKTELLSLRFLKLLAICQQPEEVLAITFTKKAANEMAERILSTLEWASTVDADSLDIQLDKDRYSVAKSVLAQDKVKSWSLLQSPSRLRIQTIDSFCNFLATRLPILSSFGGSLKIGEQVDDCYRLAIQNCLKLLDEDQVISSSIAKLMLHFDNDGEKIESLLISLLKQREQWIGDIVDLANSPEQALGYLTENLLELIEESINEVAEFLQLYESRLMPLLRYASNNLIKQGSESDLALLNGFDELPATDHGSLTIWLALSKLFLTQDLNNIAFRKVVDKNTGFPAPTGSKQEKQQCSDNKNSMKALLKEMADEEDLLRAFDYIRRLPSPDEDALSWSFLETLTAILPTLMAQLDLAFASKNKVDYPQLSLAALRALGSEHSPTDLALCLDYQIKHILVDEFQDTSSSQLDLLRKLTAGWEPEDGRTLFVVGDAMQSCYGFRNANVGLFIKLRESGIGDTKMNAIDLVANFRSDSGVVDWVNTVFSKSFPAKNDISRGAVAYSPAAAVHPHDIANAVSTRIYQYQEDGKNIACIEEAAFIADEIVRLRKQNPSHEVAILVRSRSHLEFILPALREAEIPWLANEIDNLDSLPIIADLMSLTAAIYNQADRLSWLAILRAPYCGIPLEDIHAIAIWDLSLSIFESLQRLCIDPSQVTLSPDAVLRMTKLTRVLKTATESTAHNSLSRVVRSAFQALDGDDIIRSQSERDSLERLLEIMQASEIAGSIENFAEFKAKVASSFVSSSPSDVASNPVQIMTIHKSKGLEFEHVFLPALSRPSRSDEKALLLWHQRLSQSGQPKLFLGTLSATGSDDNSLYNLLRFEKAEKSRLESSRLLYIGITRAMKSVYLSATLADKEGEPSPPASRSLLATIWDSLLTNSQHSDALSTIPVGSAPSSSFTIADPLHTAASLQRLPSSSFVDQLEAAKPAASASSDATDASPVQLSVENYLQIEIGNLVHETLQHYLDKPELLQPENLARLKSYWQRRFEQYSFDASDIESAISRIELTLNKTTQSPELQWIFDASAQRSAAELVMQEQSSGYVQTHIIDRTFIDAQGIRWIIDYKSSEVADTQSEDEFVEEQIELYSKQLQRYRNLFAEENNQGIKTALLFTSIPRLVECN